MDNTQSTVRMRIKTKYRDMTIGDKAIADYILNNLQKVSTASINDLAKELNISTSTFFQFTKRLGYDGFKDFKISLLTERPTPIAEITSNEIDNNSPTDVANAIFKSSIKAFEDTLSLLQEDSLNKAINILCQSNKVCFFGLGGSAVVASDAYHKFFRSPLNCYYSDDYHFELMFLSLMKKNDCCVVVSHSGLSKEALEFSKIAKEKEIKLIVLTSYPDSPLAKLGDVTLTSTAEQMLYRSESFASRLTQLAIIDCLFVNTMLNNEKKSRKSFDQVHTFLEKTKVKV